MKFVNIFNLLHNMWTYIYIFYTFKAKVVKIYL